MEIGAKAKRHIFMYSIMAYREPVLMGKVGTDDDAQSKAEFWNSRGEHTCITR